VSAFDRLMGRIQSHAQSDQRVAKANATVTPLVARLKPGRNFFTPDQFSEVVRYLLDPEAVHAAMRKGRVNVGAIEIVRVRWLRKDRLVSIADLAKLARVSYRTMARHLANAQLPCKRERGKKMYDLDMLREHLSDFATP